MFIIIIKKKEIPIDAMWLDIDGIDQYQIFTLSKKFNKLPRFINNVMHKEHGNFVPIVDLGISTNKESKLIKKGNKHKLFIKSGYTGKNLIGKIWPDKTVFLDFFNPKIDLIWDKGLDKYFDIIKYDGIWLDKNEIANLQKNSKCMGEILDEDICDLQKDLKISYLPGYTNNINTLTIGSINPNAITYKGNLLYNNKPLISVYQSRQTYNYLNKQNKRPFILSRSNSFGSGKYSFHWLGDNFSENKYIEYSISGIFNYNIFGIPFTGADICGFNYNCNGNLCARWYNIGSFYPFSRNHNARKAIDQYPWSFNKDIENIIKKDIQYRYSLLRYLFLFTIIPYIIK